MFIKKCNLTERGIPATRAGPRAAGYATKRTRFLAGEASSLGLDTKGGHLRWVQT